MRIALRREHLLLFCLLALVPIFVLSSILLNLVAHVQVWQIMFSTLKTVVPGTMYGS
ncbi:MAG TPA: hypothetical protein VH593_07945 [Ktedonobacteraceae bacterium]|jgi:hypothetical protein